MDAGVSAGGRNSHTAPKEWPGVPGDGNDDAVLLNSDSWTIVMEDGDETLQKRLRAVAQQRDELQRVEIELRAQVLAREKIVEARAGLESRLKEQAVAAAKLKDQIEERENYILDMQMKLDEKDRELRDLKMVNEEAWAKEEYLREQNKELASFRQEHDNSEAERSHSIKQIRDLQDHLHEKERALLTLEEQHRAAQESIIFKDEQLREAQSWINRVQEMDALQSTALQAELRERTEQFNQFWLAFHRQYVEMECLHVQTIQQLQLKLAEAKEQNLTSKECAMASKKSTEDSSTNSETQATASVDGVADESLANVSNGGTDASAKVDHGTHVRAVPTALLGVGGFLPPSQISGVHPYLMQPVGVSQPLASTSNVVSQSAHVLSTIPANQLWPSQQVISDVAQASVLPKHQSQYPFHSALKTDNNGNSEVASERVGTFLDHHISNPQQESHKLAMNGADHVAKVVESHDGKRLEAQQIAKKEAVDIINFKDSVGKLKRPEVKVQDEKVVAGLNQTDKTVHGHQDLGSNVPESGYRSRAVGTSVTKEQNAGLDGHFELAMSSCSASSGSLHQEMSMEPALMDRRALLACIVRAIPAGSDAGIRISTTLTNRLEKMLAPLHWDDYKKQYGNLAAFVSQHLELFVIEGDVIRLREGAQQIISATTAAAKVAAAAAAATPSPSSSILPSVAVTPVAQNGRQKGPTVNLRSGKPASLGVDVTAPNRLRGNQETGAASQFAHSHLPNGGKGVVHIPLQDKSSSNGRHKYEINQIGRSSAPGFTSRK